MRMQSARWSLTLVHDHARGRADPHQQCQRLLVTPAKPSKQCRAAKSTGCSTCAAGNCEDSGLIGTSRAHRRQLRNRAAMRQGHRPLACPQQFMAHPTAMRTHRIQQHTRERRPPDKPCRANRGVALLGRRVWLTSCRQKRLQPAQVGGGVAGIGSSRICRANHIEMRCGSALDQVAPQQPTAHIGYQQAST